MILEQWPPLSLPWKVFELIDDLPNTAMISRKCKWVSWFYPPLFHGGECWPGRWASPLRPTLAQATRHTPALQLTDLKLNFSRLSLLTLSPRPSNSSEAKSSPFCAGADASSGALQRPCPSKTRFLKEILQNDRNPLGLSSP